MTYYRRMINYRLVKQLVVFCLLPIAICALLSSCHDKPDYYDIDYKNSYYPLDTGRYITYQVDSISCYNTDFRKDTDRYQLKFLVADTFYDAQNRMNYRIELYRRPDGVSPWAIDRVWSAVKTQYNVQQDEDNIRFIKMVFPPITAGAWEGNLYVPQTDPYRDFQNWNYHYESVDVPYSINGFQFDSTLTAIGVSDSNAINWRLRKEIYAKGIGMIYQDWGLKEGQPPISSWDTGPWKGFLIRMRLIDHN